MGATKPDSSHATHEAQANARDAFESAAARADAASTAASQQPSTPHPLLKSMPLLLNNMEFHCYL